MSGVLFRNELRRHRRGFLIWAAVLPLLSLFRMAEYPTFYRENRNAQAALEQFSPTEIELFGLDSLRLTEIVDYYGGRIYSLLLLLGSVYVIMLAATILAKEEDDKTVEFLLVKPVTRSSVVTAKLAAVVVYTVALNLVLFLAVWGMFAAFEQEGYDLGTLAVLSVGSLLVHLAFVVVGFLLSVYVVRARTVYPISISLVLLAYFLLIVANSSENAGWVRYLSFFAYVDAADIVRNGAISAVYLVLFASVITAGTVLSYLTYNRKDLSA
ncbi:ABC-2 type transporter permease component [Micromonospora sp. ATCC 39149]|uniref:ABC transporter permease subunit n=1 Tax=Micromonospora carbonacea TaxID=47853 RepID=A0A7D6GAT7_9ACTN|nr:ABC transporter permease subunit [Micromonospora sp. ATCC 39149]EEP74852.1 ABC-2 type transporter permease component [Micromonospora sp. ATCC 39149]QLK00624.1 ABC transporter permease subunit [Micromonospora carbonacea]